MLPTDYLHIPEFDEFIMKSPNETDTPDAIGKTIDSTRLLVEVLWGLWCAESEFSGSAYSSKVLLDGDFALVIRYRRERDGKYRPACTIGYDVDDSGAIRINQIQGSRDRSVAYRVHSSFKTSAFLLKLLEESFFKKGIPVYMDRLPKGIENASYASRAEERYLAFQSALEEIRKRYPRETGKA